MSPERFDFLLQLYKAGSLSKGEWAELSAALSTGEFDDRLSLDFMELLRDSKENPDWSESVEASMWTRIKESTQLPDSAVVRMKTRNLSWWWAAASVIFLLGITGYFYFRPAVKEKIFPVAKIQDPNFKNDVLPGFSRAVLTLSNGKTIVLDTATTGLLAQQGNSKIQNQQGGLQYISENTNSQSTELIYNTLTTNRGEQFPLTLSDGTKVWLNAASSIRYPVSFAANDRVVEITGEVYFEVTHDAAHPFHVRVNGMDAEDLGTKFNINAYPNEGPIKTTLLQGSVSINNRNILKPGQQAQFENANNIKVISDADTEGAIAWKNGQFHFAKVDITTIMRQIERWYDLQIIYEGNKTSDRFTGDIPRTATLTELLSILQMARVHFKLDGDKLTVLP